MWWVPWRKCDGCVGTQSGRTEDRKEEMKEEWETVNEWKK